MLGDALSSYSSTRPKQERVETNGDGVKPGSTSPMGLGGANVQTRTNASEFEHFYPVPVCFGVIRELMQHSLGGYSGLKLIYSIYVP